MEEKLADRAKPRFPEYGDAFPQLRKLVDQLVAALVSEGIVTVGVSTPPGADFSELFAKDLRDFISGVTGITSAIVDLQQRGQFPGAPNSMEVDTVERYRQLLDGERKVPTQLLIFLHPLLSSVPLRIDFRIIVDMPLELVNRRFLEGSVTQVTDEDSVNLQRIRYLHWQWRFHHWRELGLGVGIFANMPLGLSLQELARASEQEVRLLLERLRVGYGAHPAPIPKSKATVTITVDPSHWDQLFGHGHTGEEG
jgi:hypothetical protein